MPKLQNESPSLKVVGLLLLTTFAASCATAGNCRYLPLPEYSDEFTTIWMMQSREVPEGSPMAKWILDARQLRNDVRACKDK